MGNIVTKFIKTLRQYDGVIEKLHSEYSRPKWWFYLDATCCRVFMGINSCYYFSLAMYRMNWMERNQYMNDTRTRKIEKLFNTNPDKRKIINDKATFNASFHAFIKRDWMYAPDHSAEEIIAFLKRNDAVIVKPNSTNLGIGVRKVNCADALKDADAFVREMQAGNMLMEAFIRQHPAMNEVNPTSVNTIRVVTMRDKSGEVHVLATSLRAGGKGQVVDNFHADGVQYPIDPATGIITGGGVKHDGTRNVYFHPATGKQMVGFQIPNWDAVIRTVKEGSLIPQNIRYLGWDMAITEDGCDVVEANISQGCNGMQLDGVGKYKIILKYL